MAVAHAEDEVAQDVRSDQSMNYLGVELDPNKGFFFMADGSLGRVGTLGGDDEVGWHLFDSVAMAHPDLVFGMASLHSSEDTGGVLDLKIGLAELTFDGFFDAAPELDGHQLDAVANAKDRNSQFEQGGVTFRSILVVDTLWSAGEHDTFRGNSLNPLDGEVVRVDFAVDFLFSDTTGDELSGLRTEVEDQNFFVMDVHDVRGVKVTDVNSPEGLCHPVVGGLFGDDDVMDVAFFETSRSDAYKTCFLAQFFN